MPMIDQVGKYTNNFYPDSISVRFDFKSQVSAPILLPAVLPKMSEEQGEKDDKIIAVCADDPEYRHYNDISELSPHRLQEIRCFFEDCMLAVSLLHIISTLL